MEGVRADGLHQEIEEAVEIVAEDAVVLGKSEATEKGRLASMVTYKFFLESLSLV